MVRYIFPLSSQNNHDGGMKMKRYLILFTLTLSVTAIVFAVGNTVKKSILKVPVTVVEPVAEVESVTCTGKVEETTNGDVYAPTNAIIKKIYVQAGQKIEKGQALMEVSAPSLEENDSYACYQNLYSDGSLQQMQTLTAPVSGTVTSISVSANQSYMDPTTPAVVIRNLSGLQVRLNVGESQIADIQVGQKAEITGAGFKNSCYSGTVKQIASKAKQIITTSGQETVVEVLVTVDNAQEDIKPGFTAKAKIITSNDSSVLVAPYSSVQADDNGTEYVLRVVKGVTVKTPIQTGREFDSGFEILSGVSKDDRIVTDAENISVGAHVIPTITKAVQSE